MLSIKKYQTHQDKSKRWSEIDHRRLIPPHHVGSIYAACCSATIVSASAYSGTRQLNNCKSKEKIKKMERGCFFSSMVENYEHKKNIMENEGKKKEVKNVLSDSAGIITNRILTRI